MSRANVFAFDRSARSIDTDGHLHVSASNLSRACVNPYLGSEIPGWQELGLDANRTYRMLRPADELSRAAQSFAGKPLLFRHRPITADDHAHDIVVGAVSNPKFDEPYLSGELVVWTSEAIAAIQSGEQKELSCGYRYEPVMRPGTYRGEAYDGIMTNLQANHVALVSEGRAGPNCVVGDAALRGGVLSKAGMAYRARWGHGPGRG